MCFWGGRNYWVSLVTSSMAALSGAFGSIIRYSITVSEIDRAPLLRAARMISSSSASVTIDESAAVEKINLSYVSRVLRLTLLAPEMVEAILNGRQPKEVTLPALLEPLPVEWMQQTGCRLR